jgi:hypothetical protein
LSSILLYILIGKISLTSNNQSYLYIYLSTMYILGISVTKWCQMYAAKRARKAVYDDNIQFSNLCLGDWKKPFTISIKNNKMSHWFKLVTIYRVKAMVLNATFNNIFRYIVAVSFIGGKTGLPGQNPRPVASNWQLSRGA